MEYLLLANVGMGVLMVVLAIPMILQRVRPNVWYGFRTAKTLSDESIWYPANRYAGKALLYAGVVIAVASLVLYLGAKVWILSEWLLFTVAMIVLLVPLAVCVVASLVYARRL